LPAQLPSGVRTLVMRALEKDPAARYVDGAAFVEAVEDAIAGRELATALVDSPAAVPPPPRRDPADPPTTVTATTGSSRISPPARRRRSMALVLMALLFLVAGGGAGYVFLSHASDDGPTSAAASTKKLDPQEIVLVAADYLGRPVADVVGELSGLGLDVQLKPVEDLDATPGQVTDVGPAGTELRRGDTVLVTYVRAPGETVPDGGAGAATAVLGDQVPAQVTEAEQQVPPTAQPTETTLPTETEATPTDDEGQPPTDTDTGTDTGTPTTTTSPSTGTTTTSSSGPTTSTGSSSPATNGNWTSANGNGARP
jgi:hypothetical protein